MPAETSGITGNPPDQDSLPTAHNAAPSALWLGPGDLFRDLAPVLQALAGPGSSNGHASSPATAVEALHDLDRLFDPVPSTGRLLIDDDALALEDVGLLRRFLRRHPGWHLVVCGEDPRERTARALSGEERTRWLAWPLDFDQMRWLVSRGPAPARNGSTPVRPELPAEVSAQPPASPAPGAGQPTTGFDGVGFDVGELLEENLANAALLGDDPPRFAYRSEGNLEVSLDETAVAPLIEALLSIARACAGEGSEIGVLARERAAEVLVELSFPEGLLARVPAGTDLTPETLAAEIGDEAGVAALELTSGLEAHAGTRLDVRRSEGTVQLQLVLPTGR